MRLDPDDVRLCVGDDGPSDHTGVKPMSTPIVQTSLFAFETFDELVEGLAAEHATRVYSRGLNPTVEALELKLAALERGEAARAFASGMAAISGVFLGLLRAGDHIVFVNHIYGPTLQLARHLGRFGVEHDIVLDPDPAAVEAALRPETRLLWVESPGTMLFRVADLDALAALASSRGILSGIDNTWATPLLQKPLERGFDLVAHTATKYLGGHSDVVAGAVIGSGELVQQIFYRSYLLNGGVLGPFDAWLVLRGMRTLPARLRQHESDGLAVARMLASHPAVRRVNHPALGADRELAERQMTGFSGVFSFELARDDHASVARVIDALRVPRIGVSWGGVESLVISPQRPGNAQRLEKHGIPTGLIRLSVGLEGSDVLIDDLERALDPLS